jgi:hypothetical protein
MHLDFRFAKPRPDVPDKRHPWYQDAKTKGDPSGFRHAVREIHGSARNSLISWGVIAPNLSPRQLDFSVIKRHLSDGRLFESGCGQ